jgi:hypothetical protein
MIAVIGTTFMLGRTAASRASGAIAITSTANRAGSLWCGMRIATAPP